MNELVKLRARVAELEEEKNRRSKILNMVQEALSQLRLDMKYLMFDLEATRRERDDYAWQLNDLMKGDK